MGVTLKVHSNFDKIAQIVAETTPKQITASTQALCDAADQVAAVLSGALRSSFYVRANDSSGYSQAAADAMSQALTLGDAYARDMHIQDEVPAPMSPLMAYAASAVVHADDQELGTSHTPAHPALVPGADYIRDGFEQAIAAVLTKACNEAEL